MAYSIRRRGQGRPRESSEKQKYDEEIQKFEAEQIVKYEAAYRYKYSNIQKCFLYVANFPSLLQDYARAASSRYFKDQYEKNAISGYSF